MLCCSLKAPKGGQTHLQTRSRRERPTVHTHCLCFSTTSSLSHLSLLLLSHNQANGCRLSFPEQSLAHCVCPRRHTLTLKYTLNHENFALGKCTKIWNSLILVCGWARAGLCSRMYTVYMYVSLGVLQHLFGRYKHRARNTTHSPPIPAPPQRIHWNRWCAVKRVKVMFIHLACYTVHLHINWTVTSVRIRCSITGLNRLFWLHFSSLVCSSESFFYPESNVLKCI